MVVCDSLKKKKMVVCDGGKVEPTYQTEPKKYLISETV